MAWRAAGQQHEGAVGATTTIYFPPIFLGIVTYVLWRRGLDKGTYQDVLLSHHGPVR